MEGDAWGERTASCWLLQHTNRKRRLLRNAEAAWDEDVGDRLIK